LKLLVQPNALKGLAGMPARDRAALWRKIQGFADDPFATRAWAKPLVGHRHAVRLRHGDWRAVCRIDRAGETVIVEAIGNRREMYR
jgi:mRNA-degrading endonuclease RelE of RelBE toxin-antitoxin system